MHHEFESRPDWHRSNQRCHEAQYTILRNIAGSFLALVPKHPSKYFVWSTVPSHPEPDQRDASIQPSTFHLLIAISCSLPPSAVSHDENRPQLFVSPSASSYSFREKGLHSI
jgi:hypothetical protein